MTGSARFRRHFAVLWSGQLLGAMGSQLNALALVWIAVRDGGEYAGLVVAAGSAGRLLFGLIGGVYADRVDRQRLMIGCDLAAAALVATLPFVEFEQPAGLAWLAAVAFLVGTLDSFFQPALQASLPALAPDPVRLQTANAWLDINRRLALVLGPGLAGALLAVVPLAHFFSLNAMTFVASAFAVRALGRHYAWHPDATGPEPRLLPAIADGLRAAWQHRLLRWGIAQVAVWNLVASPLLTIGAAMLIQEEIGADPAWFGYTLAAYGVGNVAANLVVARLPVVRVERVMFLGGLWAGLGWVAFAQTRDPTWLLAVTAFTACGGPMADLMLLRLIQIDIAPSRIGRVFSVRMTASRTFNALGMVLAAPLFAAWDTRSAIALGGASLAVFAAAAFGAIALGAQGRHAVGPD